MVARWARTVAVRDLWRAHMLAILGLVLAVLGVLALVGLLAVPVAGAIVLLVVGIALMAYSEGYARPRRRL